MATITQPIDATTLATEGPTVDLTNLYLSLADKTIIAAVDPGVDTSIIIPSNAYTIVYE